MHWSFWLATVLAFGFLLTNYVVPFLVRRFSSNIRISSIGLRSVRGLFLKFSNITVNIDRIALTVHRSAGGFRVGVEVYNVVVNVAKPHREPVPKTRRMGWQGLREGFQNRRARGFSIASVTGLLQQGIRQDKKPFQKRFIDALANASRAVARVFSVFALSLFIRWLPALTQSFDVKVDHIAVISEVLGGVHVISKGLTFAMLTKFTKQEQEGVAGDCDGGDVVTVKAEEKEVARMRRFRMGIERKWKDSVGRVWELSTASTNGFGSLVVDVEEIIVYPLDRSPQTPRPKFGTFNLGLSMKSLKRNELKEKEMPSDAFVYIQGPANLKASVGFSPQRMVFKRQSGELLLHVPSVAIAADKLLNSLQLPEGERDDEESSDSGGRHSVTSSMSSVSPWAPITRSFSPPGSPKIEPINPAIRWTQSRLTKRKPQKTMPQVIFAVLKGVMIDVPSIEVKHSSVGDIAGSYSASIKGLLLRLQLSEPSTSLVHQRFLGASTQLDSRKDLGVYSFTFDVKNITIDRLDDHEPAPLKMVLVREIGMEFLFTRWPTPWFVAPSFLANDPNAALVVVQANVDKIELSEQVAVIHKILDLIPRRQRRELDPPGPIIYPIPRIIIDTRISSISAKLIQEHSIPNPYSYQLIEARTDGMEIHFSSSFRDCFKTPPTTQLLVPDDQMPLQMDYNFNLSIDPLSLWTTEETPPTSPVVDEDQSWSMSPFGPTPESSFAELPSLNSPFLQAGKLEINGSGSAFGYHGDKASPGVSIDGTSFFTNIQVVPGDIVLDLSDPDVIDVLANASSNFSSTQTPKFHSASKPIFDGLPSGLAVQVAVSSICIGLAGRGVRPDESENPNRGVALRTAVGVSYSHLLASHTHRVRRQRPAMSRRDRLGLGGDSILEAMAHVHDSNLGEDSTAVIHYSIRDTSVRCIVGEEDYGWRSCKAEDPSFTPGDDLDAHLLLRIPEIAGDALFRRRQRNINIEALRVSDSCRIHLRVSRLACRIDLNHIYCILTAAAALRGLSPPKSHPRPRQLPHQQMSTDIQVQSDIIQLVIVLPSPSQKLFVRAMASKYHLASNLTHTIHLKNVTGWVPSPSFEDKWEELARLNSWTVVLQPRSMSGGAIMAEAFGKGARLRIPYKFIFSDLVTDIAVSIKAAKHLADTSFAGEFFPMPKPPVEEAKKVPLINLHVECLIIEAADDPFESKLNLIWRAGLIEQRARLERDQAFYAKVEAIEAASEGRRSADVTTSEGKQGGVSPAHTISIQEAKDRLALYNSQRWVQIHKMSRDKLITHEEIVSHRIRDPAAALVQYTSLPFEVYSERSSSPVVRIVLDNVGLHLKQAQFEESTVADFMHDLGGIPRDTEYTLLIPLHLTWTMNAAQVTIRDYPLPLLAISGNEKAWECSTNLVIAEEVGGDSTVDWIPCSISAPTLSGQMEDFSFYVPKTVNPVKTYADPRVNVRTTEVTDIAWGVSYNPPLQDVMRVVDTLSTAPRDKSPPVGFWDKLRLVLHWKVLIEFDGEVHVHLKGSRDPYEISGEGAGFVLCFDGNTKLTAGLSSQDRELIQLSSDRTLLAIPDLQHFEEGSSTASIDQDSLKLSPANPFSRSKRKLLKICAKLTNGVRLGLGFILERTCGQECRICRGKSAFSKRCRFFDFKPHYQVGLSATPPGENPVRQQDSYAGFRSDFIHFSLSLTSPTTPDNSWKDAEGRPLGYNIFHLTPKAFSHFFAWWGLFDGVTLPIRQGKYWPIARPLSPKFGRHLATIKYRFSLSPLFISHTYKQDLREHWREGETGAVGIKVMVETFKADLHQREQEIHVIDTVTGLLKKTTHKPFYAAEVSLTNIEARAVSALFSDPRKALVPLFQAKHDSYESQPAGQTFPESACLDLKSKWFDLDDFSETDWTPTDRRPRIWMFQAAHCPRFTFFRSLTVPRPSGTTDEGEAEVSKFGQEDTHICLLSKEDTVRSVQVELAARRIRQLKREVEQAQLLAMDQRSAQSTWSGQSADTANTDDPAGQKVEKIQRSIDRLETYIEDLSAPRTKRPVKQPTFGGSTPFDAMPRESFSSVMSFEDWSEFTNVYEVHSPTLLLSNSTRNVLLTYYYSSRNRRAFEYHMSTRAVKFIREQAKTELRRSMDSTASEPSKVQSAAARAANTLLKMLTPDTQDEKQDSGPSAPEQPTLSSNLVPKKSHFCLLMKPQIVLHCEEGEDAVVFLAAMEASWQSHAILDLEYIDDPVNGYIMSRNNVKLRGLQAFVPVRLENGSNLDQVPLEVLVDFKCESDEYERLIPHTDASILYDKFNRLRLHSKVSSNTSGPLLDTDLTNEHLKYQADRIIVDIPRFTITANSQSFSSLQTIITHLLLYTDPIHALRNEALEEFLFTYDTFSDFSSASEVVSTLQGRIRNLMRISTKYESVFDQLPESGQMDALTANAHVTALSDELSFIFEAIRLAQEKARNFDDDLSSALRLDVKSDLISWNMLGPNSDLLAKMTVKGASFTWTNRKDCTTSNLLVIGDLQALNGSPDAAFPEILTAYPHPSSHPMVKKKLFASAEWTVLPPVGQISIVEKLEIKMHPVKVQIERKVGRDIQEYISPKAKRVKADPNHRHTHSHGGSKGESTSTSASNALSSSVDTFGTSNTPISESPVPASMENSLSLSVPSIADHGGVNLDSPISSPDRTSHPPRTLSRAKSKSSNSLRENARSGSLALPASTGAVPTTALMRSNSGVRGLRRAKSSTNMAARTQATADETVADSTLRSAAVVTPGVTDSLTSGATVQSSNAVVSRRGKANRLTSETAEMRARAQKRTFISIDLHGFLIVLTYKGEPLNLGRRGDQGGIRARDLVPDVQDFHLAFPKFEHHNCTWSVEEFLADVKSELMKHAFGVVFRAFNARLTAKYRHADSGQTPATRFKELEDEDSQSKQTQQRRRFFSKHRNPAPTQPSPTPPHSFNVHTSPSKSTSRGSGDSSAPSTWSNNILSETEALMSSPTASRKLPLPVHTSETSFGSGSTAEGSERHRGRVLKKLFRRSHSHRDSTDSSSSNLSAIGPRTSLDVRDDRPRSGAAPRSRSTRR